MADLDAARGEQLFDIAVAEREAVHSHPAWLMISDGKRESLNGDTAAALACTPYASWSANSSSPQGAPGARRSPVGPAVVCSPAVQAFIQDSQLSTGRVEIRRQLDCLLLGGCDPLRGQAKRPGG